MTSETRRRVVLYGLGTLILLGLVYFGFLHEYEPDIGQLVASAEVCARIGGADEGIRWAERGLKIDPDHRYLHIILARCYERKEEYGRAAEYYERAVELTPEDDPQRALLRLHRVEVLSADDRADEALAAALAVTESSPELLAAWYVRGNLHLRAKDYDAAEEAFREASERSPRDFEAVALLAEVAEARGDDERARELFVKAGRLATTPCEEAEAELRHESPTPENQARRSELGALVAKRVELQIDIARLQAKSGAAEGAVDALLIAARISPARVRKALRTEPLFTPFTESERLRTTLDAPLTDGGRKINEKPLKPLETDGR